MAGSSEGSGIESWDIPFSDLDMGRKLGEGFFGVVYKGTYLATTVAVKQLSAGVSPEVIEEYRNEVAVLRALRHPNIISFMGVSESEGKLLIVTEFAENGDVLGLIEDQDVGLSWRLRVRMARETVLAMMYLHSKGVMHRDIKSGNLLLDEGYHVKVADFGIAKPVVKGSGSKERHSIMGSHFWMAPEVLFDKPYAYTADVFSFGMMLTELITRLQPDPDVLERTNDFGLDEASLRQLATPKVPDALVALVMTCTQVDPDARPSWEAILESLDGLADALPPGAMVPVKLTDASAQNRCAECLLELTGEVVTVSAPVLRKWHAACFSCTHCAAALAGSRDFRLHNGAVYCKAHYGQLFGAACAGCGTELASSSGPVSAVATDLYCSDCASTADSAAAAASSAESRQRRSETVSILTCVQCGSGIAPGASFLVADGKHYHKECFVCSVCGAGLSRSFRAVDGALFCEKDYLAAHGTKCSRCAAFITGRIMRVLDLALCPGCLSCYTCGASLEGAPVLSFNGGLYCTDPCVAAAAGAAAASS